MMVRLDVSRLKLSRRHSSGWMKWSWWKSSRLKGSSWCKSSGWLKCSWSQLKSDPRSRRRSRRRRFHELIEKVRIHIFNFFFKPCALTKTIYSNTSLLNNNKNVHSLSYDSISYPHSLATVLLHTARFLVSKDKEKK